MDLIGKSIIQQVKKAETQSDKEEHTVTCVDDVILGGWPTGSTQTRDQATKPSRHATNNRRVPKFKLYVSI